MVDWLQQKDNLVSEVRAHLAQCSALEPAPFDYIESLHTMLGWIQTANQDELPELLQWWAAIKPAVSQ